MLDFVEIRQGIRSNKTLKYCQISTKYQGDLMILNSARFRRNPTKNQGDLIHLNSAGFRRNPTKY